jgi:tyrosyl-tRNA synthetase
MMAKDSVKKLAGEGEGMSLRSLQIKIQGYDFIIYIRNTIACCKWGFRPMGNITTGTELVRRMNVGEEAKAYVFVR